MKLRPVNECLLAEPLKSELDTDIPVCLDGDNPPLRVMRVIDTPDFIRDNEEVFLKGDKVIPAPGSGIRFMLGGSEVTLLRQKDILAVLE